MIINSEYSFDISNFRRSSNYLPNLSKEFIEGKSWKDQKTKYFLAEEFHKNAIGFFVYRENSGCVFQFRRCAFPILHFSDENPIKSALFHNFSDPPNVQVYFLVSTDLLSISTHRQKRSDSLQLHTFGNRNFDILCLI